MRRLICAFVVCIWHKRHFLMARLAVMWLLTWWEFDVLWWEVLVSANCSHLYDENVYSIDIGLVTRFASSLILLVVAVLKIIMLLCLYSCKAEKMEIKWSLIVIGIALFIAGTYEPRHNKTYKMTCVFSEDSDQPGHPPNLIWDFAGHTGHFVVLQLILHCFPYFFIPDCTFRS